jgi:hypothetical protein
MLRKKLIDLIPILGKYLKFNYGLLLEDLKPDDYRLGSSPLLKGVLQDNGQWDEFLPEDERQSGRRIETMACTCFSLLNCVEIMAKRKNLNIYNLSDRFSAKMSGCGTTGNLMSRVLDSVRKNHGAVNEEEWPSNIEDFNWSEFYSSIPKSIQDKGLIFPNDFDLGYEAIWSNPQVLKDNLRYSPLYVAGYAWYQSNGLYRSIGTPNHCFLIYGYEDGKYWKAYDSYAPFQKKLAWNFQITQPKVLTLNKKGETFNLAKIKELIDKGFRYLIRAGANGEFYKLSTDGLKYVPDIRVIADELAGDLKQSSDNINEMLKFLTQQNKIKWSDEKLYQELIG